MSTSDDPRSRLLIRLAWFVGIWAASVAGWSVLAYLLRRLIRG
jgi:hypothetical protein